MAQGYALGERLRLAVLTQLTYPNGPNAGLPLPNNNLAAAGYTIDPVVSNLFAQTKYYPLPAINNLEGPTTSFIRAEMT